MGTATCLVTVRKLQRAVHIQYRGDPRDNNRATPHLLPLARQFAHGRRSRPVAWVLCHGGWVGSTPSRSRSGAWTGPGLGICAGLVAVAGISCMPARAVRISRPVGRAGCWLYTPSILVCGARLRRASRSLTQKTQKARLVTLVGAALRR